MKITLPDQSVREYGSEMSAIEIAKDISDGLARAVVAVKINGELKDSNMLVSEDASLRFLTFDDEEGKDVFWHTATHIMAQAIRRLFPAAKLAVGPATENGFFYDIDLDESFTPEDLQRIEAEAKKIVKEALPIRRMTVGADEARAIMRERNEDYKIELINELETEGKTISLYEQGEFIDLCYGPHLTNTKSVKAFKIMSVAGAYWKGDQSNKQLQRVYGTAYPKKKDLDAYLTLLEEAQKRDHRKIGKEMELFALMEEGPGFPFFLPNGTIMKNELINYWREVHRKAGYDEVETPIIMKKELWETSGHWYHYRENMYTLEIDEEINVVKPMNCPGGLLVYKSQMRSYRDLPLRMSELGRVHRHELSGALHGLMRVRSFTQDDAHIFMQEDQIKDEIVGVIEIIDELYKKFGFSYYVVLSTRPDDFMGEAADWDIAESALKDALEEAQIDYKINEGDGAFYGPKIDFKIKDSIGREWQCGTIQLDYQLPERFDITYVGSDGEKHRPIMIHRACLGSLERFIGVLIEHYAGKFPVWIAPQQVRILPISEKMMAYALSVKKELFEAGVRVEVDDRSEKIGYKIREAQLDHVPYMLIVGEKEAENNSVSVRSRDEGELGVQSIEEFKTRVLEEIRLRKNTLAIENPEQ